MNYVIRRNRLAEDDAVEGALWYDKRESGLGDAFLDEVEAAVQKLKSDALLHRVRFGDIRRISLKTFTSYGIYYYIAENSVVIIAIQRGRKRPRELSARRSKS